MGSPGRWIAAWLLLLAGRAQAGAGWPSGRPVPVAVEDGRASVVVPTDGPTLVIASALARRPGPFTMRLEASPADPAQAGSPAAWSEPILAGGAPGRPVRPAQPPPRPEPPPLHRRFWVHGGEGDPRSAAAYLPAQACLRAARPGVAVYVDARDLADVDPAAAAMIAATLADEVIPRSESLWGRAPDVDGDGRIAVLVTGWLARLDVEGCVRGADFDPKIAPPFGNGCDLILLSPRLTPGAHLRTILAHEYAHAATSGRACGDEESWLDEAMAHLVEDQAGYSRSNLDHRIDAFLAAPEQFPLVVPDDHAAALFRSHGSRGGRYLFLRWCADRRGTEPLLRALASGPSVGVANLEAAAGGPFDELYRAWSIDLYRGSPRPRADRLRPGDPAETWRGPGTSSHFALVEPAATGAVRIELTGPAEAGLQLTLLPLGLAADPGR